MRYFLDPQYHITVEVTGMKKGFGSRVFRNPHGRMLEKNLVEFTPSIKTLYGNNIGSFEGEQYWSPIKPIESNEDMGSRYYFDDDEAARNYYFPKPNKCLVSFASYSNISKRSDKSDKEIIICQSDLVNVSVKEHDLDPIIIKVDERLGTIGTSRMEGDGNIKNQVVESLKTGFNDDYCFHRPASVRFTFIAATSCEVPIPFDVYYNLFTRTDDFDKTTCDSDGIEDEIRLLQQKTKAGYKCQKLVGHDKVTHKAIYEATNMSCSTYSKMQESSRKTVDDGLKQVFTSPPDMYIEYLPGFFEQFDASEFQQLTKIMKIISDRVAFENVIGGPVAN